MKPAFPNQSGEETHWTSRYLVEQCTVAHQLMGALGINCMCMQKYWVVVRAVTSNHTSPSCCIASFGTIT
jgi:hypothetical protein